MDTRTYQAFVIKQALEMLKKGIQPNRAYTWKATLAKAAEITGRTGYTRKEANAAISHLQTWIDSRTYGPE
jgi:hypothetical protein